MKRCAKAVQLAGIALAALVSRQAEAQNFQRIAPKEPVPTAPNPANGPPAAPAIDRAHDNRVVVPDLKGISFVNSEGFQPSGVAVAGIKTTAVSALDNPAFRERFAGYLGKPVTFAQLQQITASVSAEYRQRNGPLVRVSVPPQNVDSGTIQVVITEIRAGSVTAEGNRWFSSKQVLQPFHVNAGDPIYPQEISQALDEANENPFRKVELVYRSGNAPGTTNLVAMTQDRLPFRPYVTYDNTGAAIVGRGRYGIGFNWGKAFGLDSVFSYQFTTSSDFFDGHVHTNGSKVTSFASHSAFWTTPLPWGDRLIVFGAYERTRPDLGPAFDLLGETGQASMRYVRRLPPLEDIKQSVQLGFDFKTTNNNLDFGGSTVSANRTDVDQFLLTYSAARPDRLGVTSLSATVTWSPGGLTAHNEDANFQPSLAHSGRQGAHADYVYFRGDLERSLVLPSGGALVLAATGQISNGPLIESEQVSLGGITTMRGYEPNSINGDEGIYLSGELRSPNIDVFSGARGYLATFLEYAALDNKDPAIGEPRNIHAASAGISTRFDWLTYLQLRASFGWQLQRLPNETQSGEMGLVSVTLSY